jgi:uncharacterized protein (DUF1501 family)
VHAVASAYRERSNFDGQNVLKTGGAAPGLARATDDLLERVGRLYEADA